VSNLTTKFLRLFLPVAALVIIVAALYSAANWLLVAGGGPIPLDEDLATYWMPAVAAFVLALIVVHPRLKMLRLNEKRGVPFLYDLLATAVIAAPVILTQVHIGASAGRMAHVEDAAHVLTVPDARFFTLGQACFDRSKGIADVVIADDDDRGDVLSVTFYVAIPACQSPAVWLDYSFRDTVSNRQSDADKNAAIKAFAERTDAALNAEDFSRYRYFERAGNNANHRALTKALRKNKIGGDPVVLLAHGEAFADRGGHTLLWALASFAAGLLLWLLAVLIPPLRGQDERVEAPAEPRLEDGPGFRDILIPRRDNYGLAVLLDINILVYLAMVVAGLGVMNFATDDLLDWGASYRPAIHGFGVLRLITSQLVHGGFLHIANNMQGLLFAAICLAPVMRNARLILSYLLCGLGGSIASVSWSVTVSVGASGAIFGLYGILLVLYALKDSRIRELGPAIWTSAGLFVALNLVFGFVSPSTDNACHIGGLLTGLVLGVVLFLIDRPRLRSENTA
jgi:membrane associated rhomboid family serine protease